MRSCSFLPAATDMIYELGLQDRLHGVTFECRSDKPKIVRSQLEGRVLSSAEIDRIVSEVERRGETLYYLDFPLLECAAPDVIFTQHVCNVCQIGTAFVERAVHKLPKQPKLVALVPRRLSDVWDNASTIGRELRATERSQLLLAGLDARIRSVVDRLRAARARPTRALVVEWIDPIYNCGHWIPDQVALAGGTDLLCAPGAYSVPVDWESVRKYDPEVLVIAPCGFDAKRAASELGTLCARPGFAELSAVRNARAFVADAQFFTQPSVSQLTTGIELLASFFHPQLFPAPESAAAHFAPVA
jgi:iron complex transport system substrate-binding protein